MATKPKLDGKGDYRSGDCWPCYQTGIRTRAVAQCQHMDYHKFVCEIHLASAAACDFAPQRFGESTPVSPYEGVQLYKKREAASGKR